MSTTPQEIEMALPRGFGYRRDAVDSILEAVEAERQALRADLATVRQEVETLRARLSEQADQESDTRAELVRARQQLEQDRQETQQEKEMILSAAHQLAEEIQRRAQRRITEEGWELHRARIERQRFVENFRGLLLKYMEELDYMSKGVTSNGTAAVAEIPPEVFAAAADRLFVPPGFEAPTGGAKPVHERYSS
jgi:cell division initiation protein